MTVETEAAINSQPLISLHKDSIEALRLADFLSLWVSLSMQLTSEDEDDSK